ncbi:FAD-binding oxidoreductase [Streptomyces sp. NPDC090499]|uniref:FAD-binding oxidoreductase n=1 Tax=Streptomyces sp. NPDC090499 TaxID=3365965 RepID=UPI00381AED01
MTPQLAARIAGPVFVPGDDGYDEERTGYQTLNPHRPSVVVAATSAEDVRVAVEYAAERGLPVAVQATGHAPAPFADGCVLITTGRMTGVHVDPAARTARFEAGVRWQHIVDAAAPHGLAPLSGSAPGVGAVSYTLGGGLGLLARRYGYAADHVRSIDLVTADGKSVTVTADSHPDLFWALRGGRDNFGVVTALEIGLFPVARLYGGGLYFPGERAQEILEAYRDWTATVPDETTSSIALVPLPHLPHLPEPIRGKYVVHVRIAHCGDSASGADLVAPLRALGPRLLDTVGELPYAKSGLIHSDPPNPMAYVASNVLLREFGADTAGRLLELAGPGAPRTAIVEVRHLGGALSAEPAVPNAVGHRDAAYLVGVLFRVPEGDSPAPLEAARDRVLSALEPLTVGRGLNFLYAADPGVVRAAYDADAYARLRELKAVHDPGNRFRANLNIPPADGPSAPQD